MSWRQESTFKPTSRLDDAEKDFLKIAKKFREVLKLEEKQKNGDNLEELQLQKIASKESMIKDLDKIASKLPPGTEVFEKNQDIRELLPSATLGKAEKKKEQAKKDSIRREAEEERKREEKIFQFQDIHSRPIVGICVSADCRYIYTCSKDKYVLCWSMQDRLLKVVCTFAGHTGAVWATDISSSNQLISGSADEKVHLWRGDPGPRANQMIANPLRTLQHGGIVRVLRWCPFDADEGRRFASASEKFGSKPAAICVWRVERNEFKELIKLEELPTKANDLRWFGGAKAKLLSAHDNGYVGVWSADDKGALLKTIKLHSAPVAFLHLCQENSVLLTASHDSSVCAVDITTPKTETITSYKANRPLNCVVASKDFVAGKTGYLVVGGGKDPMHVTTSKVEEGEFDTTIVEAESGQPCAAGEVSHFGPVHYLLELPTLGKYGGFASASEDGFVYVHDFDGSLLHKDTPGGTK